MRYPLGARAEVWGSAGLFKDISKFLVTLTRGALEKPSHEFKDWALSELSGLVRFDSCAWTMGAWVEEKPVVHTAHLYRLREGFIESWLRFQDQDRMVRDITCDGGRTFNVNVGEEYGGKEIYDIHCKAYGVEHLLATALIDPDTKLLNILVLYRADSSKPFTEAERAIKEVVFAHMIEACRTNWLTNLPSMLASREGSSFNALAACDASGLVQIAMPSFVELCREEWPGWTGPFLSPGVVANLAGNSRGYLGQNICISTVRVNDIFILRGRKKVGADNLSHREWQIAQQIADGQDYKTIAQVAGISPATVRTHVNNIFAKLGINDKAKLAGELGRSNLLN